VRNLSSTARADGVRKREEVWQAELVPYPASIGDDPDARPCVALVVADGAPVWAELHRRPSGEAAEVAELLATAVQAAVEKWGRLPVRVEARHTDVVEALAACLAPQGVGAATRTRLDPLDAVAAALVAGGDPERMDPDAPRPCTSAASKWSGWALPPEVVAELFAAAAAFYRGRPWEALHPDALLEVETAEGRVWALSILGAGAMECGVSMYSDPADRDRVLSQPFAWPQVTDLFEGRSLYLAFEPADELPPQMRREVARSGWEASAAETYPVLFTINTPGGGVSVADARDLASALRTIASGAPRLAPAYGAGAATTWTDPATAGTLRLSASRWPPVEPVGAVRAGPPASVHVITVTLEGVEPPIWRRVEVASDLSLRDLSDVVQGAMGWAGYHLYGFEIGGVEYRETDDDGWLDHEDPGVSIGEVAGRPGAELRYVYDFGDDWAHGLVVESVGEPEAGATYPRCVAGARACPPEDCGGVSGYHAMVEALGSIPAGDAEAADVPDMLEAGEWRAWAGDFDPERFDVDETNRRLDALARGPVPDAPCASRLTELGAMLMEVASVDGLPLDLVTEAIDVLRDYALEDPGGFLAGRKPEILLAAALHSAGMILETPWSGWRPTLEEMADRFGVSTASVASRSRAIRDVVFRPHPFHRLVDEAVAMTAALAEASSGRDAFPELLDAVGFEPPEGPLDVRVLADLTGLPDDDVARLTAALARAVERERGRSVRPDTDALPLAEGREDQAEYEAVLREVLRDDDVSSASRDALARWVVGRLILAAAPSVEWIPMSSLLAVSHLAGRGVLRGDALADAVMLAVAVAPDPEAGMGAADVHPLARAVGADEALDRDERAALLLDLFESTALGRDGRVGPDLVTAIAADDAIPVDIRFDALGHIAGLFDAAPGSMRTLPAIRRLALVRRILMEEEDPVSFVEPLLDTVSDTDVRGRAAADLLESHGSRLPRAEAEALIRRGLAAPGAAVRQAFFRVGLAVLGDDVRQWAPEALTDPSRRGGVAKPDRAAGPAHTDQMRLL
jgi:hypothetical protein